MALAAERGGGGLVLEVWWGLVERDRPRVYDWQGHMEIIALAMRFGLKVRAVMVFHQRTGMKVHALFGFKFLHS